MSQANEVTPAMSSTSTNESSPEVSCSTCEGVCCSDVMLALSGSEAEFLRSSGTDLTAILPCYDENPEFDWADNTDLLLEKADLATTEEENEYWLTLAERAATMSPGKGLFAIKGRCGNLNDDNLCSRYAERPDVCRTFEAGQKECLEFRHDAGVGVPVVITRKPSNGTDYSGDAYEFGGVQ